MDKGVKYYKKIFKGDAYMGFLAGKTAIITGAGRAVLSDGSCGSIGYGIATAYACEDYFGSNHGINVFPALQNFPYRADSTY